MKTLHLLSIAILLTFVACKDKGTAEKANTNNTEQNKDTDKNNDHDGPANKVSLEAATKGLKGKKKDAAEWLYNNYKGRLNPEIVTQRCSEMDEIMMLFIYDQDKTKEEVSAMKEDFITKYDKEMDLSHLKSEHSCANGFVGADEMNPYFSEFEFIQKNRDGSYEFNCTVTAENMQDMEGEQKFVKVKKTKEGFKIDFIRCRKAL